MDRPDLNHADPAIIAYIEYLEGELKRLRWKPAVSEPQPLDLPPLEPDEPPTTWNIVTLTRAGLLKRTPRHLYSRQRRGGMGIFDLETREQDEPINLSLVDENQTLLLFTDRARAFRLVVNKISASPVRSRGESISAMFALEPEEHFVVALPTQASGYISLVSQRGMVRSLRHHLFGDYLKPGTSFFNYREAGPLAAASWTTGDSDLFIATRKGVAIRFSEKLVPPQGILGIRVDPQDAVTAITPVRPDSRVFLLGSNGKGTIRSMDGFNPNKSPGGSGKNAMKTDQLISAVTVNPADDLFIITRLSKIIRFKAGEIPETDGVVQGVQCVTLRNDECISMVKSGA